MSIRIKLTLLLGVLIFTIGMPCCFVFILHDIREHKGEIDKLGTTLITLLAKDNEIVQAINYKQPSFLLSPIQRIVEFDRDNEVAYVRIADSDGKTLEKMIFDKGFSVQDIPDINDFNNPDTINFKEINASSGEVFHEYSLPIHDQQVFSEEKFAARLFGEKVPLGRAKHKIKGYAQIGISTREMTKNIYFSLFYSIVPAALGIIFGGICIWYMIDKSIILPIQQLAKIAKDIAKGNLKHMVAVHSHDEIGQLTKDFNFMSQQLEKSYSDLKKTADLLKYRLKVEELIALISTNFINFYVGDIDIIIHRTLESIGRFSGVDRSYLFLFYHSKMTVENTYEWCGEWIQPKMQNRDTLPIASIPWWIEKLKENEVIHIPSVNDLPDNASVEKEILQSQGIKSLIIVPIIYSNTLIGFLGFDSIVKEKKWTSQDITLLKMVGEIFANALEHKRKEELLQNANEELEKRVKARTIELLRTNQMLTEEVKKHKQARDELKKYGILFSEIQDLAYICDDKGDILFVNPTFEELTHHKPEEFVGKSFESLFDGEYLVRAKDFYRRTLHGESPQIELLFKDTGKLCEYKNLPLRDDTGNIIGVIGTARDITLRKRMEDQLLETNQTLQAIISASPLAIVVLDVRGNVKMWNPSAERIFGWTESEILGSFYPIIPQDKQEEFCSISQETREKKRVLNMDMQHQRKDGLPIYINVSAALLYDVDNHIKGILVIVADITERIKILNDLKHAKDYAENLIETANVMVLGLDTMGNIQVFNKTAEDITGYKKEEVYGKNCFHLLTPKEKYPYFWKTFQDWQKGGQLAKTVENPILTKSGREAYISWQNTAVREQGHVTGSLSFGIDLTEQRRMNALVERMRLTSFIKDLSFVFNQNTDLSGILQQCTGVIVEYLDVALARIWTLNEKEGMLDLQASSGLYKNIDGSNSRIPVGKFIVGRIARQKRPYITNSFKDDPHMNNTEWLQRNGIVSFVGYPLMIENHLVGVVVVFAREPLDDYKTRALASVADIIALGIDREQSESALHESEMRLQSILDNTTAVVYVKDLNGKFLLVNQKFEKLFHITNNEITGKTDHDLFPKKLADNFRKNDLKVIKTQAPLEIDEETLHDDGPHTYISVKFPLFDSGGEIYATCGISTDITERKRTEEALRYSENKNRMLLENLPQRVFYKDKNSVYVSCNKKYADDLGIKPDEISGKTDYDFYSVELAGKFRADDKRIMMTGKTEECEEKFIKDGQEFYIQSVKTPIRDEGGELVGILCIFWDITERMNLQMEAVRSRHLVSLGELAAGVAHEINNPINGIINYAQILVDETDMDNEVHDISSRIIKEGTRIANIVNSLLFFAKPTDKKEKLKTVHIRQILKDPLTLSETQLKKEGILVKVYIPKKLPQVKVNVQQIQQVFLNIISNARYALNMKYAGTHENKIFEIASEEVKIDYTKYVKIVFYDRGIGIPANMVDKIMDPFFSNKPRGQGTGLGLSISHRIISQHGGKILTESVEGDFTKVSVLLPV